MTISYWIGYKLGVPFFHKHGHRIHLGPDRLEKMSNWFENYGNKLLLIAYFIPGSVILRDIFQVLRIALFVHLLFMPILGLLFGQGHLFPLEKYWGRSGSISILR